MDANRHAFTCRNLDAHFYSHSSFRAYRIPFAHVFSDSKPDHEPSHFAVSFSHTYLLFNGFANSKSVAPSGLRNTHDHLHPACGKPYTVAEPYEHGDHTPNGHATVTFEPFSHSNSERHPHRDSTGKCNTDRDPAFHSFEHCNGDSYSNSHHYPVAYPHAKQHSIAHAYHYRNSHDHAEPHALALAHAHF